MAVNYFYQFLNCALHITKRAPKNANTIFTIVGYDTSGTTNLCHVTWHKKDKVFIATELIKNVKDQSYILPLPAKLIPSGSPQPRQRRFAEKEDLIQHLFYIFDEYMDNYECNGGLTTKLNLADNIRVSKDGFFEYLPTEENKQTCRKTRKTHSPHPKIGETHGKTKRPSKRIAASRT